MNRSTSNPHVIHHNRQAWNHRVRLGLNHTRPAEEEWFDDLARVADVHGWLPKPLTHLNLLCLAAGGGRHGPIYAAAGARVTVVDLSPEMLALDREVAAARGFQVETVEASMDDLRVLGEARYDVVIQPVSTCYVPDIRRVYREVARVMKPGALYVSQHKQPASLQSETVQSQSGYAVSIPYDRVEALPMVEADCGHREAGCYEFLHTWEDLIGGLCRAGFHVEDLIEPSHGDPAASRGSFGHRCRYLPPFVAVKARRCEEPRRVDDPSPIWVPPGSISENHSRGRD